MMKRNKSAICGLILGLAALTAIGDAQALDIDAPADAAETMVKMRCSLDPAEHVIAWWKGTVFALEPGKTVAPLLGFEGYNICRGEKLDDGTWRLVTREVTFYRDLKTGEILDEWDNPLSGKRNKVVDVANDPVNNVVNPPGRPAMALPWLRKAARGQLSSTPQHTTTRLPALGVAA